MERFRFVFFGGTVLCTSKFGKFVWCVRVILTVDTGSTYRYPTVFGDHPSLDQEN